LLKGPSLLQQIIPLNYYLPSHYIFDFLYILLYNYKVKNFERRVNRDLHQGDSANRFRLGNIRWGNSFRYVALRSILTPKKQKPEGTSLPVFVM